MTTTKTPTWIRSGAPVLGILAGVTTSGLLLAGPAWAAGTGYSGGAPAAGGGAGTGAPTAPPGFANVLVTQTVPPTGGSVTASGGGSTVTVTVPGGAVTSPIQVVITEGNTSGLTGLPAGSSAALAYGITFLQNGQKYTGTFKPPITVTINNPTITSANGVVIWNAPTSSFVPVSQAGNLSAVNLANGALTFSVSSDPYIALLAATSSVSTAAVPGATTPTTGMPWLAEAGIGSLLVAAGCVLALRLRRTAS